MFILCCVGAILFPRFRSNAGGICESWVRLCEKRTERPIVQIPHVTFKNGIDDEIVRVDGRQEAIGGFVRPVQIHASRERDEPVLKGIVLR